MKFDRVVKQYGIDKLDAAALEARRAAALIRSKDKSAGAGASAHWRAVVAACEHYLNEEAKVVTVRKIIEGLRVLEHKLELDGAYVSAATCYEARMYMARLLPDDDEEVE